MPGARRRIDSLHGVRVKFAPSVPQIVGINFLAQRARAAIQGEVGIGKTGMVLTDIVRRVMLGQVSRVLVVAPAGVLLTEVWPNEVEKWDHTRGLSVTQLTGTPAQRREKLARASDINVINFELLPWLIQETFGAWPYNYVVVDEAHRLGSYDGVWFRGKPTRKTPVPVGSTVTLPGGEVVTLNEKSPRTLPLYAKITPIKTSGDALQIILTQPPEPGIKHLAEITPYWVNMTGTPCSDTLESMWSQTFLLDSGVALGKNISAFRDTYFQAKSNGFGLIYHPLAGAADRIGRDTAHLALTLAARDYLPIDEPVENTISIPLPNRAEYDALEKEFLIQLETGVIEAANSAVLSNKLRQFCAGAMYHDDARNWTLVHDAKIDVLKDLLAEIGRPCVVVYDFASSCARLLSAIKGSVDFSEGDRSAHIAAFVAGDIPVLLLHPASAGEGVNGLQDGTDTMVFFDLNWSLRQHTQIVGRIGPVRQLQSGHPRPVLLHYLAMSGTVDEAVIARWRTKASVQDTLLNHYKGKI